MSSPGNPYDFSSSRTSSSTRSRSSESSIASTLLRATTMYGTLTCLASSTCSRVCGIGPSTALTTQDRAVHLGGAGDHVLDVIGVARAVDVRVMPVRGRVLDVARRDGENLRLVAAALRLGRFRDLVVRHELGPPLVGGHLREGGGERGLAVVDVSDRADVDVRFAAVEFLFSHVCDPRRFYRPPSRSALERTTFLSSWLAQSASGVAPRRWTAARACQPKLADASEGWSR